MKGSAEHVDEDAMRDAYEVNVLGPALGTAVCVPGMRAAGGGAIVFVSSIASIAGGGDFLPYAASKSANATYARCAARELGQIRHTRQLTAPGRRGDPDEFRA